MRQDAPSKTHARGSEYRHPLTFFPGMPSEDWYQKYWYEREQSRLWRVVQFVTIEINKLVAKEIIQKRPNPADGRSTFLGLTRKAIHLLRELGPVRRKIKDIAFRSLTRERAENLQKILVDLVLDARRAGHEIEAHDMRDEMAPSAVTSRGQSTMTDPNRMSGKLRDK